MMAHTLGGAQTALFPLTFMDRDRYIKCFLTFVRSATFPFRAAIAQSAKPSVHHPSHLRAQLAKESFFAMPCTLMKVNYVLYHFIWVFLEVNLVSCWKRVSMVLKKLK
jgi:hypothetical protein